MANKADLLTVLQNHQGAEHGIGCAQIAMRLGCEERRVRTLVSEARMEGIAIAAHPKTGYYIAESAAELELCCEFLRAREMHSLVAESRMRKIPLPELLGQLRLPT